MCVHTDVQYRHNTFASCCQTKLFQDSERHAFKGRACTVITRSLAHNIAFRFVDSSKKGHQSSLGHWSQLFKSMCATNWRCILKKETQSVSSDFINYNSLRGHVHTCTRARERTREHFSSVREIGPAAGIRFGSLSHPSLTRTARCSQGVQWSYKVLPLRA